MVKVEMLQTNMEFWTNSYEEVRSYQKLLNIEPIIRRKEVLVGGMKKSWVVVGEK